MRDSQLGECLKKAHIQVLSIRVTAYLDNLGMRLNQREQFNPTVSSLGIRIHLSTSLPVGESLDKEIGEGVGEFP